MLVEEQEVLGGQFVTSTKLWLCVPAQEMPAQGPRMWREVQLGAAVAVAE